MIALSSVLFHLFQLLPSFTIAFLLNCLDFGPAYFILSIKVSLASKHLIAGCLKKLKPWIDQPMEGAQSLKIFSLLHALHGKLLLCLIFFLLLLSLDVLLVVVK